MKLYAFAAIALLTLGAQTGSDSTCGPPSSTNRKSCSVVGQKCTATRAGCCDLYICVNHEGVSTCQKVVHA